MSAKPKPEKPVPRKLAAFASVACDVCRTQFHSSMRREGDRCGLQKTPRSKPCPGICRG